MASKYVHVPSPLLIQERKGNQHNRHADHHYLLLLVNHHLMIVTRLEALNGLGGMGQAVINSGGKEKKSDGKHRLESRKQDKNLVKSGDNKDESDGEQTCNCK